MVIYKLRWQVFGFLWPPTLSWVINGWWNWFGFCFFWFLHNQRSASQFVIYGCLTTIDDSLSLNRNQCHWRPLISCLRFYEIFFFNFQLFTDSMPWKYRIMSSIHLLDAQCLTWGSLTLCDSHCWEMTYTYPKKKHKIMTLNDSKRLFGLAHYSKGPQNGF